MSKIPLTVFFCTGKDCQRAWHRICHQASAKWLKRQGESNGFKLKIIKTGCMDRCDEAACLCCVKDGWANFQTEIRSCEDLDLFFASLPFLMEDPSPKER